MIKIHPRLVALPEPNIPIMANLKAEHGHQHIIKLNYNESNFGPTPKLRNWQWKPMNTHLYPELGCPKLVAKLAKLYKLPREQFWVTNGSDAILDALPSIFSFDHRHNNVVLPSLTFKRIEITCQARGIPLKRIPLKEGLIDLDATLKAIDEQTAIVYVVNPNMPTGKTNTYHELDRFLSSVPEHVLVVLDEAYGEYVGGVAACFKRTGDLVRKHNNLLVTRTFSKLFALASLRVGYAVSRPHIIKLLHKVMQTFPLPEVSQEMALVALSDIAYYDEVVRVVKAEKMKFYNIFTKLKIRFYKSDSNFIYVITEDQPWTNEDLYDFLLVKSQILIRKIMLGAVRISVGTPAENAKTRTAIQTFIENQKR